MGRLGSTFFRVLIISILICIIAGLPGCGKGTGTTTPTYPIPASVTLTPGPYVSMELGTNQMFTASVQLANRTTSTQPVFFQSSNTAVVTVAANGLACAGSWDNLANPQVCTPGPVGVAQVTATAQSVDSPPTTVYVHQHIDKVVISQVLPPNTPPPTTPCLSVGQMAQYAASAYSRGVNITSTVGVFNWQAVNANVVTLSTAPSNTLPLGQVQVTAETPGITPIFASIGTASSVPLNFTTCPVQSIALQVTGSTSTSRTIVPTVIDTLGMLLTGVPLTWSSSQPASVSVSTSGLASASTGGGAATVIASCTPPTCNIGFLPSQPIYPENVVLVVPSNSGSTQASSETAYVSSTGCGTTDSCISTLVTVTSPAGTTGTNIVLPATPNSLVFDPQGDKAYIGTNSGLLGTKGLAVLTVATNTVTQFTTAPGKVLAVSPDGKTVILSDTTDTPNQVFVFDTTDNTATAFSITGATAADFSPDSLKAYIVAGSTLYVYSQLDALQTIPLAAAANDVSFLAEGAFAYLAGGDPSGVAVRRTCDNGVADTVATPAIPSFIKTLPDATRVLALDPSNVDLISVTTTPAGCTPSVSDSVHSFNLGLGNIAANQLVLSQDGSAAYILAPTLNSIVAFNTAGETSTGIPLTGNVVPLQASLTPDGTTLFVGANDGTVHVIQAATNSDVQQVPFIQSLCQNSGGLPFGVTCNPDLVAVKP